MNNIRDVDVTTDLIQSTRYLAFRKTYPAKTATTAFSFTTTRFSHFTQTAVKASATPNTADVFAKGGKTALVLAGLV
jgi:hypothetical protein